MSNSNAEVMMLSSDSCSTPLHGAYLSPASCWFFRTLVKLYTGFFANPDIQKNQTIKNLLKTNNEKKLIRKI